MHDFTQKKAEELGIEFIETSAKDSTNVENAFVIMARQLIKMKEAQIASQRPKPAPGMRLQPTPQPTNGRSLKIIVAPNLAPFFFSF